MLFILVPIVIAVFVALAILGHIQAAKRRDALRQWARAHSLHFSEQKDHGLQSRFANFDCLRQGERNRYAFNIIQGDWLGRRLLAFDYHYETTSTDSKGRSTTHHHYFSATILQSHTALEPLRIRPEGIFDKVTGFFGFEDINFESAEFSRQFHVTSPNRRWAYDVIHARTMQMLLDAPRFTIELDRDHVIASGSSRWDATMIEQAAGVLTNLLEGLPNYVREQQQERHG